MKHVNVNVKTIAFAKKIIVVILACLFARIASIADILCIADKNIADISVIASDKLYLQWILY